MRILRPLIAVVLGLLLLACVTYSQRSSVNVAYLSFSNTFVPPQTFEQGIALAGSSFGTVTIKASSTVNNYTLGLPSTPGQSSYYLCAGTMLGTLVPLAYCSASGSGAPLISITPSSLNYSSTAVGTPLSYTFLVTNTGNAVLTFSSTTFTFSGTNSTDFSVSQTGTTCANSGSVNAGAVCTLTVTFTPGATGNRTGALNIADNVSGSPQTVALSGTGT